MRQRSQAMTAEPTCHSPFASRSNVTLPHSIPASSPQCTQVPCQTPREPSSQMRQIVPPLSSVGVDSATILASLP